MAITVLITATVILIIMVMDIVHTAIIHHTVITHTAIIIPITDRAIIIMARTTVILREPKWFMLTVR